MNVLSPRLPAAILFVILALLAAACGGAVADDEARDVASPATPASSGQGSSVEASLSPEASDGPTGETTEDVAAAAEAPGSDPAHSASTTSSGAEPSPSRSPERPEPMDFPHENTVPVSAELTPTCVVRGGTMTLRVETEPEAAVSYQARYAGNEGGGDPPYGHGHGGNDGGMSDKQTGTYASSWQVSPDAPVGGAVVDVVVAWRGEWGYAAPTFDVVERPQDC